MATPESTSELNAINTMLAAIGESPVSTLSGSLPVTAVMAMSQLAEASRQLQAQGWHFNTEHLYPLVPTIDEEIVLSDDMLKVDLDPARYGQAYDVVRKGSRLYDKLGHTYTFTDTLEASIVWLFNFEDIPEAAKQYITIRAARVFGNRAVSSSLLDEFSVEDEKSSLATLKAAEADSGDYNIFLHSEMQYTLMR